MPFGLSRRRNRHRVVVSSPDNYVPEKYRCMILRLNIDCNACCRKLSRIVMRMKGIETHMIEKQERKLFVCGRLVPSDVAIHIKKKMNRRVEILEIQEMGSETSEGEQSDNPDHRPGNNNNGQARMVAYPGQAPPFESGMALAYCKSGYTATETVEEVWENCDCACIIAEEEDELPFEDISGLELEVPSRENNLDQY